MSILQRIAREPNAIVGVVIALYGVLVAFEVLTLTAPQAGALAALGGAVVVALRWFVTPASEVVVQQKPGEAPVHRDERGAIDLGTAVLIAILVLLVLVVLGILGNVR